MKIIGRWKKMSGRKKIIVSFVVLVGVGLTAFGCYSLKGMRGGRAIAREISAQETQAKMGTISDTIVGTGNLAYEEASSVTIPSGVVVDEVKVEESDSVTKGDVLAVVNQASVLGAMEEIRVRIPSDIEEIRAINNVFFDLAQNLSFIEMKKHKLSQIKLGMMSDLLTEKIRLV